MSYEIIRNTKYKRENLKGIYRHNERRNKNYSNANIDKEKSYLNYAIKSLDCQYFYRSRKTNKKRRKRKRMGFRKIVMSILKFL